MSGAERELDAQIQDIIDAHTAVHHPGQPCRENERGECTATFGGRPCDEVEAQEQAERRARLDAAARELAVREADPRAVEARALERVAKHLDALAMLALRPAAPTYLRERAAKLRSGAGWEDDRLLAALDEYQNAESQPRPRKAVRNARPGERRPSEPGVIFDEED